MPQHPRQRALVPAEDPVEDPLAGAIQPAVPLLVLATSAACAHIIGVVVSETTSETPMATESVTANSRNSRPTMPPISRIGMNTATSETLIDSTVKPISLAPSKRRLQRRHAIFQMPRDVLDHHDRVVDDEAGGDRQRHQRQVVDAVAGQIHHAERADQRDRHGDAGNERGPQIAQETETRPGSPARSRSSA